MSGTMMPYKYLQVSYFSFCWHLVLSVRNLVLHKTITENSDLTFRASSIPLGFLWKPAGMSASGVGA